MAYLDHEAGAAPAALLQEAMAEPQLIVRRIGGVDLRAATELLVAQQRAYGRDTDADKLRPIVQAALEDVDRVLMLGAFHEGLPGFAHGKMVGMLTMSLLVSIEHAGEVGHIEQLYVRDDYRRKGLGDRLLSLALDWSAGRGLRAIDVEVAERFDATAAQGLYGKKGFNELRRTRLAKSLAGG
jgi:ribosomal protein S18 acetylase RimI-like enzyme